LRHVAVRTPLIPFHRYPGAELDPRRLYIKPENLQPVGSFKLRGAYNKIASLTPDERRRGVIAYSSGNHAQGTAYAARALGVRAVIVMPSSAPAIKRHSTAGMGAEIVLVGPGSDERKAKAEELARLHGYIIVPPYNDEAIIAGQGTIGLEILEDLPQLDVVLAPVGGGGLVSGVAAAVKQSPATSAKVVGVEPDLAADALASVRAGRVVAFTAEQTTRTMADGLRTQSIGEVSFQHIRRFVDAIVTVTEQEIEDAMRLLAGDPRVTAEPSGAVPVAAFLFHRPELPPGRNFVAVLSGGNVEPGVLQDILRGRTLRP
jgi:threonine dehydratase